MIHKYYNEYHLGDCIQNVLILKHFYKGSDIQVVFYCNDEYHAQLQELVDYFQIPVSLDSLKNKQDIASNIWVNRAGSYYPLAKVHDGDVHAILSEVFAVPRETFIPNILPVPFHNLVDPNEFQTKKILVINSDGMSGQVNKRRWQVLLENKLSKYNKEEVITTQQITGYDCTRNYGFSVLDIAIVSCFVEEVFAIDTSPLHLCLNHYNMNRNLPFYIHHNLGIIPKYPNIHLI